MDSRRLKKFLAQSIYLLHLKVSAGIRFEDMRQHCTVVAKGQLISKGIFGFFNSPKNRTKNFCPSRLGQKLIFSSLFFGRIGDTKISF